MSEKPSVTLDEAIDWAIAVASGHEPNLLKIHTQAIARHLTALKRIKEAEVCEECDGEGVVDDGSMGAMMLGEGGQFDGCTTKPCHACNGTGKRKEAVPEEVEGWAQVLEKPKDPGHADRDRAAAILRYQAAEIERLGVEHDAATKLILEQAADLSAAKEQIAELKALLREVEWHGRYCPSCGGIKPGTEAYLANDEEMDGPEALIGHAPDCKLKARLENENA